MSKPRILAGLAAAAFATVIAPTLAQAQSRCVERQHDSRVLGTVIGALGGALLGNA